MIEILFAILLGIIGVLFTIIVFFLKNLYSDFKKMKDDINDMKINIAKIETQINYIESSHK